MGHFVGKRPAFPVVSSIAKKLWIKEGIQDVIAQENGFIFFLFSSAEGMEAILDRGPWFIAGRYLVLKKWERNLNLSAEASVTKVPVWALLYNVSVQLWTPKGLSYIASALGKPLFADSTTVARKRLNYARVCVEIEAGKQLLEEVDLASGVSEDPCLDPIKIKIVYQWKPLACSHCRVFGHSPTTCVKNLEANAGPKNSEQSAFSTSKQNQDWRRVGMGKGKQHYESAGMPRSSSKAHQKFIPVSNSFQPLIQNVEGTDFASSGVDIDSDKVEMTTQNAGQASSSSTHRAEGEQLDPALEQNMEGLTEATFVDSENRKSKTRVLNEGLTEVASMPHAK